MKIGDLVTYHGRACYLRGFDPMSVTPCLAEVEDVETGDLLLVPLDDLEDDPLAEREPR